MKQYKILIVDDLIDNIKAIRNALAEYQDIYLLLQALTGEMALKIAKKESPDLIITDWEMPEMDGISLIRALKTDPSTEQIPVIMCTGVMTTSANLETALLAGAVDYVRKPIDPIELKARIQSVLKLSESYQEIRRLNEGRDRIYSIIGHDLRGPIAVISSLIDVLSDIEIDDKTRISMLAEARVFIASVFGLLDNLLLWANSQRNRIEVVMRRLEANSIASNAIYLLTEKAEAKNIQLINNIAQNLLVKADENMLSTLFRNLIANSIKFTPNNGQIVLSASQSDGLVTIEVRDSGLGMSKEMIQSIFIENKHLSTIGTNKEKGTGLGLQICKEFVSKQNGKIWAESQEGHGTSIFFSLELA